MDELVLDDDAAPGVGAGYTVAQLRQAWINERSAPELMYYDEALVDAIKGDVDDQQAVVLATEGAGDDTDSFRLQLFQMEIDRIEFLLHAYHRARLAKIERHALYIAAAPEMQARLSGPELNFVRGYVAALERHMHSSFLQHVPAKFRRLNDVTVGFSMVPEPDLSAFVVMRVLDDVGSFQLSSDGDEVVLRQGAVLVSRYRPFRGLLHEGKVQLL